MTITTINHNPKNDSKYARHRSIWKGTRNQVLQTVDRLRATPDMTVYEYLAKTDTAVSAFQDAWNVHLKVTRRPPRRNEVMGQWVLTPVSSKLLDAVPGTVKADMRLIWPDFLMVTANRIGKWWGSEITGYHGKSLILFAAGPAGFDFVMSKYGLGEGLTKHHHFYHWQSRTTGLVSSVDSYENDNDA